MRAYLNLHRHFRLSVAAAVMASVGIGSIALPVVAYAQSSQSETGVVVQTVPAPGAAPAPAPAPSPTSAQIGDQPAPATVPTQAPAPAAASVAQQEVMRFAMPILMMVMAQIASGGLFSDKPGADDAMERQIQKLLNSPQLDATIDRLLTSMMQQEGAASTLPPEMRAMMKTTVKSLLRQMRDSFKD
jgi:hypothetical protein